MLPSMQCEMYSVMRTAKDKIGTKSDLEAIAYMDAALRSFNPHTPEFWLENLDSVLKALKSHSDEDTIRRTIEELEYYLEEE